MKPVVDLEVAPKAAPLPQVRMNPQNRGDLLTSAALGAHMGAAAVEEAEEERCIRV